MKKPESVQDFNHTEKKKSNTQYTTPVKGIDFNTSNITLDDIIVSYKSTGFQSFHLYKGITEINNMIKDNYKIYFGCTSNLISSGIRDIVRFLVEHKHVHVCVITAGGIEEDLIKCFKPTYCAQFNLKGIELRSEGLNRVGNLLIPSENYELFETWFNGIMDELVGTHTEQNPLIMTPSKFIKHLGLKINNKESVLYWAAINDIPIYSPALTDGSIGDLLTFYKKRKAFKLDIVEDIREINFSGFDCENTGAIILGSGLVKHHILNANLFRNGLDKCVLINTTSEYDGCDGGANIEESVSWGKIKANEGCVKIVGDAAIIFPLVVYSTFYKVNK